MRYLLDTNMISNITKPRPSVALLAWMSRQVDSDLYIASLTMAEIRRGVLEYPAGKRLAAPEVHSIPSSRRLRRPMPASS